MEENLLLFQFIYSANGTKSEIMHKNIMFSGKKRHFFTLVCFYH